MQTNIPLSRAPIVTTRSRLDSTSRAIATLFAGHTSVPVEVNLYDENARESDTVAIWRDGSTDEATSFWRA